MKALGKINPMIAILVAVAILVALLVTFWPGSDKKYVTAEFPRTVSLYEGSDVKILGVAVGKVEKVVPAGTKVKVTFNYDEKYKVPADAKAAVISPSIVGDRFVQLTPVYTKGPELEDHARLGVDRTGTPLELDEIFGSINDLNIALGPDGANKADPGGVGPLTRLLDSTARNFGGQGVQFNKTLKDLGAFTKTLADNKDELFGTLAQVEKFTSTLAKNDGTVRKFNDSLAGGAQLLAGEREELAAVLRNLSVAMVQVRSFVKENRASLTSNISGLNRISKTLVKRRAALDETLRYAPAALNNLFLAGNVRQGTLDTRDNLGELFGQLEENPADVLCSFIKQAPGGGNGCDLIRSALGDKALGRAKPFAGDPSAEPRVLEPVDRSLGGLVEVTR
ncbi:MAG: virulence factor Mce family protein [Marmoricola sp.]|nr:virulence factor Mce family protein [Marmoricola sp.]